MRWRKPREVAAPSDVMRLREGSTVSLNFYGGEGEVRSLSLRPVTDVITAQIGAQVTFEVVGIERVRREGEW